MSSLNAMFPVLLCLLLLVVTYWFSFRGRPDGFMKFVRKVMLPFTIIGGVIIYFIGYHMGSHEESTPLAVLTHGLLAIFSTGRLFVLGNDLVEIPSSIKENLSFLVWFSLIGASAVFISGSILLHLFAKNLITRLRIRTSRSQEAHVFFGVHETSLALAKDILGRDSNRLVVILQKADPAEDTGLYHEAAHCGALVIDMESVTDHLSLEQEEAIVRLHQTRGDVPILRKIRLLKRILQYQSHLYFLGPNEEWNLNRALRVREELKDYLAPQALTFHIRTCGTALDELLGEQLPASTPNLQFKLLNEADIAARQLLAHNNPVDWIPIDTTRAVATRDFKVLMIGFGPTGQAILRRLIALGQFSDSGFKAVVVDTALKATEGRFVNHFPGLVKNYTIEFACTDIGSNEFFHMLKQQLPGTDYLVIAREKDHLNLETALDIRKLLAGNHPDRLNMLVQQARQRPFNQFLEKNGSAPVQFFGQTDRMYTENIVVHSQLETMGRRLHDYYNSRKAAPDQRMWHELSPVEKETNMSAADHIHTKLRLCGLQAGEVNRFETADAFETWLGPHRIENLARGEHAHWNAVLFTNGWDTWALANIPPDAASHKDPVRKLHACLVDWEELEQTGQRFGEDFRKYDYDTIRNLFTLIREGIYFEKPLSQKG